MGERRKIVAKKEEISPLMELRAVYTGDSKRFHKFEIVADGVVGSIYIPKETRIPNIILNLISKGDVDYPGLIRVIADRKAAYERRY